MSVKLLKSITLSGITARIRERNKITIAFLALNIVFLGFFLLLFQFGCAGKNKGGESLSAQGDWKGIWDRSEEAGRQINSFSMEISVFYQGTEFGSGLVQSSKMKVSGEDFSVETSLFGQPVSEAVQVGGNRYTRSIVENKWKREKVSVNDTAEKGELEKLSSIPENASSVDYLGVEELESQPAHRLRFYLESGRVLEVLPSVPREQIAENKGATIDVWIRESDFQRVKYEMTVRNTKINEKLGFGDLRVVVNIRDINERLIIKPPI